MIVKVVKEINTASFGYYLRQFCNCQNVLLDFVWGLVLPEASY